MNDSPKPFSPDSATEIRRLESALEAAGVGSWELDLQNDQFRLCVRLKNLLGFTGSDIISFDQMMALIHPDDRTMASALIRRSLEKESGGALDAEFRIAGAVSGKARWLAFKGLAYFDGKGNPYQLSGIAQNATHNVEWRQQLILHSEEIGRRERELGSLVENTPDVITRWNKDLKLIFANTAMEAKTGVSNDSLVGKTNKEMGQPDAIAEPYMKQLRSVFETRLPQQHYNDFPTPGGNVMFHSRMVPEFGPDGSVEAVLAIARDVTALKESEARYRSLIEEAPVATGLYTGPEMKIELANETILGYWGKGSSVIGRPLAEVLPELQSQSLLDILQQVYTSGKTYESKNGRVDLVVDGKLGIYYFDFTYKALRDSSGKIYGVLNTAVDVTQQVLARKALEESEIKLRSVIESAPAAIGLFMGRELIIEMPNQAFIDIVGKGPGITGKPLREAMPELEGQPFLQILDDVYTSGKMFQTSDTQVDVVWNGKLTHNFYNFTYTPIRNSDGEVYAILEIAIDVTERVLAQKEIESSQQRLLALFEQSPVAIAIICEKDLVFEMSNPFYAELVGRMPDELVGKSLLDALPELQGQGFDQLLKNVITTGIPFVSKEQAVEIMRAGKLSTIYVDLTYQPQRETDGKVTGVLVVATDVTEQVLSRRKIQEAESTLRGAVDLAELGTWEIDLETRMMDYSSRLKEWFGIGPDEIITVERAYQPIRESDKPLIKAAIDHAITPGTNGIYEVEYHIEASATTRERILKAQGKTYFDEKGEAVKITGTAQDVTQQRKIQLALEQQVQERTEELEAANEEMAAINEELASINEEYMATNEELSQSNSLLSQSNENLQQFAYVASHDLQEPLRKIQSFGDLLKSRHMNELGAAGIEYIQRMQTAAGRMSLLIEDLLEFSRASTRQDVVKPISLATVVHTVLSDLEIPIQETGAVLKVEPLPVIHGDELQLGQLFQNLLSNALKFRRHDTTPHIEINSHIIGSSDLPPSIKPARLAIAYHRINISDNGIGFDQKYTDRIFQVFQRLHGKNEFAGTGIGLAICEKVAINHGGAISAVSEIGKGSIFSVYLPV